MVKKFSTSLILFLLLPIIIVFITESEITIDNSRFDLFKDIDLAEYFITSKAEKKLISNGKIKIEVRKAEGKKCERCWKILEKKCLRKNCAIK